MVTPFFLSLSAAARARNFVQRHDGVHATPFDARGFDGLRLRAIFDISSFVMLRLSGPPPLPSFTYFSCMRGMRHSGSSECQNSDYVVF